MDTQALERIVGQCLDEARRLGVDACEAAATDERGLSVGVRMGEVETVEYQHDRGVGVTVYFGQRKGSASTADLGPAAVKQTVEAACRIARFTAEDEYAGLADPGDLASEFPDLDLDHPWGITPEAAITIALEVEQAARDTDARIVNSEGAGVTTHRGMRVYGNSHGFIGSSYGTRHEYGCVIVASDGKGMQRDHWYTLARAPDALEPARTIGREAARRALERLGARRPGTRRTPVLFSREMARGLIGHLLAAMRGSAHYRGATFLLDRLGEAVLPGFVTVSETPHEPRGPASRAFDDEGVATVARDLVEAGAPTTWLLDSYAARRLRMRTTGHAGGLSNIRVSGDGDTDALMREMGTGFMVTELMGQGVNLVTGDYSRGASGFWIEDGAIAHPVEEVTIAGNLSDMFAGIIAIGADADERHAIRTGPVLVGEMTLAGA